MTYLDEYSSWLDYNNKLKYETRLKLILKVVCLVYIYLGEIY